MPSVAEPTDAEAKAFYDEHKAQIPQGQSFDDLKGRIKQVVRQQKLREGMGKMLEDLKSKHRVQVALERSEEHTSELQSPCNLVCRLLLEKKKKKKTNNTYLMQKSTLSRKSTKSSTRTTCSTHLSPH